MPQIAARSRVQGRQMRTFGRFVSLPLGRPVASVDAPGESARLCEQLGVTRRATRIGL